MFEFECEGKNGINKLSVTTDDFDKFSEIMILVDKFARQEEMKPIFCISNYTDKNYAMHCDTKEKANIFCKYLDAIGRKWCNGAKYCKKTNWNDYKENTCYSFCDNKYASLGFYKEMKYLVLEFDDYDWSDWECVGGI